MIGEGYVDEVQRVRELKRQGRLEEAEVLLLETIEATEAESRRMGFGVAPWYYWQLAIVYRKQKRLDDELALLERYDRQIKAPGSRPAKLRERLEKVREMVRKKGEGVSRAYIPYESLQIAGSANYAAL
jgi:hypothetical protein